MSSWIREFEFDVYDVKKTPVTKSSTPSSATEWTAASPSSQTAKPVAPKNISFHDAREIAAADSAPTSAPAPNDAESAPNVRGPECSVCLARIGSRMLKLKQRLANTTIIPRITRTPRERRA